MGLKSIREIVETAVVAHLNNQGLTGVQVVPGISAVINTLPIVVASVESVGDIPEIAQGLGNFRCTLTVMIATETDEANSGAAHRERTEKVMSAMQDATTLAGVFTTQADASMYSVDFRTMDDGRGDRTFGTSIGYELKVVLAP